jgi:hypothetical protein
VGLPVPLLGRTLQLPQQRRNGRLFAKRYRSEFNNALEIVTSMTELLLSAQFRRIACCGCVEATPTR